jgi:hypothetical protein
MMARSPMRRRNAFIPSSELLSAAVMDRLSSYAIALYGVIANEMRRRNKSELMTINYRCARKAKIPLDLFENVQMELVSTFLLEISRDVRPDFVTEAKATVYRWPDPARVEI